MKNITIAIVLTLAGSVPAVRAGLPLNLTGTTTFSLADVSVNDQYEDTTIIGGVKIPLRLVLMGRQGALDLNLVSNLYYNEWSGLEADLFTLNVKHVNFGLTAGDSYVRQRKLTIMNRKIRGLSGYYDLLKVNTNELLKLQVVGGISDYAFEKDEKLAHQVYRRSATAAEYRQYLGGAVLKMKPSPAMNADLSVVYATDDVNSVETDDPADAPEAANNMVISGSADYLFWGDRMFAAAAYARSATAEVIDKQARTAVGGNAANASLEGRLGDVKFRTAFDYVAPEFHTEGNPYLETDRIGGFGQLGYVAKGMYSADASFETYVQNLDDDSTKHDTRTNEIVTRVGTAWKWNPNLNLSYRYKDELSSTKDDGTLIDRTSHTVGGGLDVSFEKIRASFGVSQKLILDDSQLYIADTAGVDSTVNDVTGQLSISTSLRWKPNRTYNVIAGINNIIGTTEGRDGGTNSTSINYVYASLITSFADGRYRPTLDVIYSNYADRADSDNDYGMYKAKLSVDYRVSRAQSAKVFYEFEMNRVKAAGDLDYTANGFGAEYTLLF